MAEKINRTVVRNTSFQKNGIGIRERHNERKNESYSNPDIVPERSHLNIRYKECSMSYCGMFDRMVADGTIRLNGLRSDAKVFGELVFDVNTKYFDSNGGYEYAKRFFREAFHFAEKEIGSDYILSAIMHADEIHRGILNDTGQELYHYHLHVTYIPVVQSEKKWSKRCKDTSLVGTRKEIFNQVSNSKKWAFPFAVDENGNPVYNRNGKRVRISSYSLLQDRFHEHMRTAGYDDIERGERGSTAEHLSVVEYKTEKAKERLIENEEKIAEQEERLDAIISDMQGIEHIEAYADDVSRMGKYNADRKIELTEKQHMTLTTLAREGLYSLRTIQELKGEVEIWKERFHSVVERFKNLHEETCEMRAALRVMPEKIKEVIATIFSSNRERVEKEIAVDASRLHLESETLLNRKTQAREEKERSR